MPLPESQMNKNKLEEEFYEAHNLPKIYYHSESDKIFMEDAEGKYRGYRKPIVISRLVHENSMAKEDAEVHVLSSFSHSCIDTVIEIGGLRKGLHQVSGHKVLVPSEQKRIQPVSGDWSTIRSYLIGMLGNEQFEWFLGWLKTWLDGYYQYIQTPGQVLILIGDTSSGKTLLKTLLGKVFGGVGQPIKYMTGGTGFNGELCGLCCLCIDDKLNDLGRNGKRKLKAECKEMAVAGEIRFELKNKTAFTASPIHRLLICCNYTEDSVSVIPDIDPSTKNKISILECYKKPMPMKARTAIERKEFMNQLEQELPAMIHYALYEHHIDDRFADLEEERMGVRGYHNQDALDFVENHSTDGIRLLGIIEAIRKETNLNTEWVGKSGELAALLKRGYHETTATATSIGKFLSNRINCGSRLVKLIKHRTYWIDLREQDEGS